MRKKKTKRNNECGWCGYWAERDATRKSFTEKVESYLHISYPNLFFFHYIFTGFGLSLLFITIIIFFFFLSIFGSSILFIYFPADRGELFSLSRKIFRPSADFVELMNEYE